MKRFVRYLCFAVLLTLADGRCNRQGTIVSIAGGSSADLCNIIAKPSPLTALTEPNRVEAVIMAPVKGVTHVQRTYPIVSRAYLYSFNEWKILISLVDFKAFRAVRDAISCPDGYDGGAEWIQVNIGSIPQKTSDIRRRKINE